MQMKRAEHGIGTVCWWRNLLENDHMEDQVGMGGYH
jgi:hypothetical protein